MNSSNLGDLKAHISRILVTALLSAVIIVLVGATLMLLRNRQRAFAAKECDCLVDGTSYGRLGSNGDCQLLACGIGPNNPFYKGFEPARPRR